MRECSHSHVPTSFLEVTADPGGRLEEAKFAEASGGVFFLLFSPAGNAGCRVWVSEKGSWNCLRFVSGFQTRFSRCRFVFCTLLVLFFISYRDGSTKSHPNRFLV